MEAKNLKELTGHKTGIVCRENEVVVYNWEREHGYSLPLVWGRDGIVQWPSFANNGHEWAISEPVHVNDVRDALPGVCRGDVYDGVLVWGTEGMEILKDDAGEIPLLFGYDTGMGAEMLTDGAGNQVPTAGLVYVASVGSEELKIIVPTWWD